MPSAHKTGTLYLIPVTLGESAIDFVIPPEVKKIIHSLDEFIVENEKSARQFLKACSTPVPQSQFLFHVIEKHNPVQENKLFFQSLLQGKNIGLMSEAGVPAVADPGAAIVKMAHEQKIKVVPLTGPSSILLALMASGLNGQQFCFHGYLPIEKQERMATIKKIEKESAQKNQTQLFIETPYRNNQLLADLVNSCAGSTLLCVATDISLITEKITTQRISDWKKSSVDLHKKPTVFLLLSK